MSIETGNDDIDLARRSYNADMESGMLGILSAKRYIAVLEREYKALSDLFETNVTELEEMNKTQAADIAQLIKEKNQRGTLLRRALEFLGSD